MSLVNKLHKLSKEVDKDPFEIWSDYQSVESQLNKSYIPSFVAERLAYRQIQKNYSGKK